MGGYFVPAQGALEVSSDPRPQRVSFTTDSNIWDTSKLCVDHRLGVLHRAGKGLREVSPPDALFRV